MRRTAPFSSVKPATTRVRDTRPRRGGVGPVESLEPRELLNATPVGPQVQVSSNVPYNSEPAIAMAGNGNFAVAWVVSPQNNSLFNNIMVQRYNASDTPVGSPIQVNVTTSLVDEPSIAMDSTGDFVVAYHADYTWPNPPQADDLYARRYNS